MKTWAITIGCLLMIATSESYSDDFSDFDGELYDGYGEGFYEETRKPDFSGGDWERTYEDAYEPTPRQPSDPESPRPHSSRRY